MLAAPWHCEQSGLRAVMPYSLTVNEGYPFCLARWNGWWNRGTFGFAKKPQNAQNLLVCKRTQLTVVETFTYAAVALRQSEGCSSPDLSCIVLWPAVQRASWRWFFSLF